MYRLRNMAGLKNVGLRTRGCIGCVYLTQAEGVFLEGHDNVPGPIKTAAQAIFPASQPGCAA